MPGNSIQKSQFPVRLTRATLVGGIFWILTLEFFVGQAIAQLAWKGQYSLISDAISDLGVTVCGTVDIGGQAGYYCSPLHNVMNASFILAGGFILLGLYFARAAWPWNRTMRSGFVLLFLAGIGKVLVGLAPANVDFTLHFIGGIGIILGNVGLILVGLSFRRKEKWAADFSLILGGIGVLSYLYFLIDAAQRGLGERIADYPVFAWFAVLGVFFILRSRSSTAPAGLAKRDSSTTRPVS
jgi:hypothetical membrane protein